MKKQPEKPTTMQGVRDHFKNFLPLDVIEKRLNDEKKKFETESGQLRPELEGHVSYFAFRLLEKDMEKKRTEG